LASGKASPLGRRHARRMFKEDFARFREEAKPVAEKIV
jgi:hypothetical protein